MITFLRRIRRSLIGSGKGSQYALYAVGEIGLVVLGILIALQINNWKTQLEDRRTEKHYFERIISDIEGTALDLGEAIESARFRVYVGIRILGRLGFDSYPIPEIIPDTSDFGMFAALIDDIPGKVSQDLTVLKFTRVLDVRKAGFNEITSSAKLSVIRDVQLRSEIVDFYEQLDDWEEANTFFRGMGERYLATMEAAGIGQGDMDADEVLLSKLQSSPHAIAIIKSMVFLAQEQILTYGMMKSYVEDFAAKLELTQID